MLKARSRLDERVVLLDAARAYSLERAVMRADDGSCRACVIVRAPLDDSDPIAAMLHEKFLVDALVRARVPEGDPFVLHRVSHDHTLVALVERAPLPLPFLDVIKRMRAAGIHAAANTGALVLTQLVQLANQVRLAVDLAINNELGDVTIGLDGAVSLRPRTFHARELEVAEGPGLIRAALHLLSPEAARGFAPRPASSLPAIAYLVYLLLSLEDPYGVAIDASPLDRLKALLARTRVPLLTHRPDLPGNLTSLIDAMLLPTPEDRPRFDELMTRCRALDGSGGMSAFASVLAPMFADERERAKREAADLASTSFDALLAAAPAERPAGEGGHAPAVLLDDGEHKVWPGDGRLMRRVKGRLWVDEQPVTGAAYQRFLDDTGRRAPKSWIDGRCPPERAHAPVVDVSLEDARAYARWADKRLPLSDDWRAAMTALGFDKLAGGQVWEWTASRRQSGYVVRGGRFRDRRDLAPTMQSESWDDEPAPDIGFRCVAES